MLTWMTDLVIQYKYLLLTLIAIPEGSVITAFSGALIRIGTLSFWPAYICLMLGDIIADVCWYMLGYYRGDAFIKRYGSFFGLNDKRVETVKRYYTRFNSRILFISKLTTGFGFAVVVLFTAGMVRVPFKKYLFINVAGQFIWTAFLIAIGFYFSHLYITLDNVLGRFSLIVTSAVIIFVVLRAGIYIKKRIK